MFLFGPCDRVFKMKINCVESSQCSLERGSLMFGLKKVDPLSSQADLF